MCKEHINSCIEHIDAYKEDNFIDACKELIEACKNIDSWNNSNEIISYSTSGIYWFN